MPTTLLTWVSTPWRGLIIEYGAERCSAKCTIASGAVVRISRSTAAASQRSIWCHSTFRPLSACQRARRSATEAIGVRLSVPHSSSQRRRTRLSTPMTSWPRAER